MTEYSLSPVEQFPSGEGCIRLETNNVYKRLLELKRELENARDSMEKYFKDYGPLFRSVTSNFGSFKSTRFHISSRFNTPSVSNSWIIMYEILSHFDLIPKKSHKNFIHFNSENLPGSSILAVHHFIHTMRRGDFKFKSTWFSTSPLNIPIYKGDDICNLMQKYPRNWPTSKYKIKEDNKEENSYIPNGDVTDVKYTSYVKKWLITKIGTMSVINQHNKLSQSDPKICLFTGNIKIETGKKYNSEELLHNKLFLGQLYLCCNVLKIKGDAVLRNTTFFSLFNISLIAWISMHFEKCSIYKPMSSKKDSSEIYLICKGFKGISHEESEYIKNILLDPNYDYDYGQLLKLNKITKTFWRDLYNIMNIYKNQISNIKFNIYNFNIIKERQSRDFNQDKMLKDSQRMFSKQASIENIRWGELHPMKPLHQNDWFDVFNTTKYNRSYRRNRSENNYRRSRFI